MKLLSLEPESSASANSAMPAYEVVTVNFYTERSLRGRGTSKSEVVTKVTSPESSASANSAIPAYWLCRLPAGPAVIAKAPGRPTHIIIAHLSLFVNIFFEIFLPAGKVFLQAKILKRHAVA